MPKEISLNLLDYAKKDDFKGWDPYDGLNSLIFKHSPFYKFPFFRLCWIQLFKRNPINLRTLCLVPKERNPKGIALFTLGLLNLYKITKDSYYINESEKLLAWLSENYTKGYSGHAWGYNFPWQNRQDLKEKYFPTIVTTTFVGLSFLDGYEVTQNEDYLNIALSSSKFILNDLNIHEDEDAIAFSYGPEDHSTVYNATALGSHFLARLYFYTKDDNFKIKAQRGLQFVVNKQNKNGSWFYGDLKTQQWIDNFHTGYNLIALNKYEEYTGETQFDEAKRIGYEFFKNHFFSQNFEPKYFHNNLFPIDIHSCALSILTFLEFNDLNKAKRITDWTINHMKNRNGKFFYYQVNKYYTNKLSYMRWSQGWMFTALTAYDLKQG